MQEGSTGAVDSPGVLPSQWKNVPTFAGGVVAIQMRQSLPTTPYTDNFMAVG
jgi:hypothetical protein